MVPVSVHAGLVATVLARSFSLDSHGAAHPGRRGKRHWHCRADGLLVSVVLGFQSQTQLAQFGAQIYTVDLVSISMLREMGGLLTAILVAGRSGSAFAAEIGVMQLNEEISAMETMGIKPFEALVIPRMVALLI